ncbi:MAG: 50S ribosome-binding GTPase [Thermoplasmata archaeon]|nr:50S ribosome-binding GTPase [Thermoplasmata archaeon]
MFDIPPIKNADELLDKAFGRAKKIRDRDKRAKTMNKISTVRMILDNELGRIVKAFPTMQNLHPFYHEFFDIIAGIDRVRKAIYSVDWARKKINYIARYGIRKVKREEDYRRIIKMVYGRISSILYKIDDNLIFLEDFRNKIKDMPSIDVDMPTIIIAGYPNVGKSSLLKALSRAKPEIASYPFTTKTLIVGHIYLETDHEKKKIQVIEAPGLLDRPIEKRNKIEMQALAALRHLADLIIFIVDASMHCGYELEKQMNLLEDIKRHFDADIIVVENKVDISGGKTNFIKISCANGNGLDELRKLIDEWMKEKIKA